MRSIWKGHIRFSLVTIPIRIYSAIETGSSISFKQLHKTDNGFIGYDKKCKTCGEPVKTEDIMKGYEYEPDKFVIMQDTDFEKIKLKSTKIIEIEAFVDANEVHLTLFDTPYFAGPDGDVAVKVYGLLAETLRNTKKLGIGKVVMRDKEDIVLIAPDGPGLLLYKIRYPEELRNITQVPQLDNITADDTQVKLAEMLVQTMTKPFSELNMKDRYKESLMEIINAKIDGKEIVAPAEDEAPVVDILTALQESINQVKAQMKPMVKATGKKEESALPDQKQKTA